MSDCPVCGSGHVLKRDVGTLEAALDSIRFAAKNDLQRGATGRARSLIEAANLMEAMAEEIARLSIKELSR